jgi:hypothetical protein
VPDDADWYAVLSQVIDASHLTTAHTITTLLESAVAKVGLGLELYLVDLAQRGLHPVVDAVRHEPLDVDGTLAGRAFRLTQIIAAHDEHDTPVLWVPLLDGTERVGVVRMTLPAGAHPDDPDLRARCWTLAGLIGHLVVSKQPYSDLFHRIRRTKPLTVPSELVWQLLPPQTFATPDVIVAAVTEPFDQVGGDGFDYAVDGARAYLAVFDSVGHDLHAGLVTSMALAATRNARRAGADLPAIAGAADAVLAEYNRGGPLVFSTAVLVDLDLRTGTLRYLLAGHPPPVLLRNSRQVRIPTTRPRVPLGLGHLLGAGGHSGLGEEHLEPGDRLLLYTDGVTEARNPRGDFFGLPRLIDLTERHEAAQLPPPETLRRITHAVLDHQENHLQDDATLMLLQWSTTAVTRMLPSP